MRKQMSRVVDNLLAERPFEAMGLKWIPKRFGYRGELRGAESIPSRRYRLVEQNPRSGSRFADLAKNGLRIAWLFENGRDNAYVGYIVEDLMVVYDEVDRPFQDPVVPEGAWKGYAKTHP
jgi:hypothetical protein